MLHEYGMTKEKRTLQMYYFVSSFLLPQSGYWLSKVFVHAPMW